MGPQPPNLVSVPRHLRPNAKADIHPVALLPGDPARALALAQALIDGPLMTNHARGLWGYSGHTADGLGLTIQSTGIGAASGAVVLTELVEIGVRRAVRIGTCTAVTARARLGEALVVERAPALDGVSRESAPEGLALPDAALTEAVAAVGRGAVVAGADPRPGDVGADERRALEVGAEAIDLQAAALLSTASALGIDAACVSIVAVDETGDALDHEALAERAVEVGLGVSRSLASTPATPSRTLESD